MDFIRRSSYSKNGRSNKPYTYDDTLEKIDLGSDHRTKPAESELSPIREEPRSGGSLTSPLNEAWASSVSSAEIMTKKQSPTNTQSISDWGSPPPGEKRLPDTAYPALEREHPLEDLQYHTILTMHQSERLDIRNPLSHQR